MLTGVTALSSHGFLEDCIAGYTKRHPNWLM
jgi:hypothetical protein